MYKRDKKQLLLLLPAFFGFRLYGNDLPLKSALEQNLVSVSLLATGNVQGLNANNHTGKCIAYTIRSLSATSMHLTLEAGYILDPADTLHQPMLFTQNSTWDVKPGDSATGYLNAMCANHSKKSPTKGLMYKIGIMAVGVLKKFADFIALKGYQNSAGQSLLWSITNKRGINGNLISGGSKMEQDMREFARTNLGIIIYPKTTRAKIIAEKNASVRITENFKALDSGVFVVKIYDQNGKMVLQKQGPDVGHSGQMNYAFWVSPGELPSGTYTTKYLINGKENFKSGFELKFE